MSAPAGWYLQPDGQQRYWDGELWTEHVAPGVAPVTTAPAVAAVRKGVSRVAWVAVLALLLLFAVAMAATSGIGEVFVMLGLTALAAGVLASVRGRLPALRLASRRAGLLMAASVLVVMAAGCSVSPTVVTTDATGTVSDVRAAPSPAEPTSADAAQTPTPPSNQMAVPVVPLVPVATAPATTTPPAATAAKPPAAGTALAAVATLTVKGRAPKTGYTRDQFGQAWYDTDHNGCDTRNDILRRDLTSRQMQNDCKVLAGTLAPDPYTGTTIRFIYGGASEVDIDHVVALSDAWQKGAASWLAGRRLALANDPLNLLAVDASANRAKGDGDAATWLPANKAFRCSYVARQVAVKGKYGVWVTAAERDAMTRVLAACPTMPLPGPGSAPTTAALPRAAPTQAPPPVAQPAPAPAPASVYYANCPAARAAGVAPIYRGQPGYRTALDRDRDGIACE